MKEAKIQAVYTSTTTATVWGSATLDATMNL